MEQATTPSAPAAPSADVSNTSPPAAAGAVSSEERTLALAAHGLTFVEGGLLGPFVIYLLKKDESDFVAFHALQSLAFTGLYLLATVLTCGLGGVALLIPFVIFEIIACIRAYEGQWYELPVVGAWARRKHPGGTESRRAAPPAPPPSPSHGITPPPAPLPSAPNPTGAPMPNFY